MKKIKKRVFAAALAAALLFTMSGMTLAAVAKETQTEDISESVTTQAEDDAAEEKTEAMQESESEGSDTDEPGTGEDDTEGANINFCVHHKEHTKDCGYNRASEGGEESPCTYECRICPIEDLIAALPDWVTEDNAEIVHRQLDEILDLYRELMEREQEQIDISRCEELWRVLDASNVPNSLDESEAEGTQIEGCNLFWTFDSGTLTIRGTGEMADFYPTSPWNGEKADINKVVIEFGVTSIGDRAFSGHIALESAEIPTSVTEIGFNAFQGCEALQSVTIPASVKTIGSSAFASSGLTSVTIQEGVETIGFNTFEQCRSLTEVTIPASVKTIGQSAFSGCSRLSEVTFTSRVAPALGNWVFDDFDDFFPGNTLTIRIPHGAVGYTAENGWPEVTENPEHTWDETGLCVCGEQAVAKVEISGATTYYGTIDEAWDAMKNSTATITLLADVTASNMLTVNNGSTITFEGGSYTLSSGQQTAIQVNGMFKLVSGTIRSTYASLNAIGIDVNGKLEMTGGTVTTSDRAVSASVAVRAASDSNITISDGEISGYYGIRFTGGTAIIKNGEITGRYAAVEINSGTATIEGGTFIGSSQISYGLNVRAGSTAVLRGGTFTGRSYAVNNPAGVSALLDDTKQPSTCYAYFENGQPVNLDTLEDSAELPDGTYTVGKCTHPGVLKDKRDGTHSGECPYCGIEFAAVPHTLGADNKCEGCNAELKVQVEIGSATTYYATIDDAWFAATAEGVKSAVVTLLADVTEKLLLTVSPSDKITLNGGSYTLSIIGFDVYGGQLDITGGTFKFSYGSMLLVSSGTIRLSGGEFISTTGDEVIACRPDSNLTVGDFLLNHDSTDPNVLHYAYYKDNKPLVGVLDQTILAGPVKVGECKHDASFCEYVPLDGGISHQKTCLACGAVWDAESHSLGKGNACAGCKTPLVAKVGIGSATTYYGTIESAWTAMQGKTATLTLLDNVTAAANLEVSSGSDITFNGGNYTLTGSPGNPAIEVSGGKLTINSGTLKAVANSIKMNGASVDVESGTLIITGGTLEGADGVTNGMGLLVYSGTVQLSGGKFIGGTSGYCGGVYIANSSGLSIGDLLLNHGTATEPHYAFFDANNNPVSLADSPKELPGGPYTVKECTREYTYSHTAGTTKHTLFCQYCGAGSGEADCSFTWTRAAGKCNCGAVLNVAVSDTKNLIYNGTAKEPGVAVTLDGTALEASKYTVAYDNNVNAGNNTASVSVSGTNWSFMQTFSISKATLMAEGNGIATGTYGNRISELIVNGLTVKLGGSEVPGTWKLAGSTVPDVGDIGTYTATFTPASGAGNYETLTAQVTLKIEKAAAPVPQTGMLYVQNNKEQSYQYDLTQLLPALDNGKSYGTVGYTLKAVNFTTEGYYTDGAEIAGTTLTLPVQKAENSNVSDIGTVSITITSGNYKDMSATITVKSANKAPVTITGVSVAGREYNGKAIGYSGTPKAAESNGSTAAIGSDDFQYTWQTADGRALSGAPKDAGSYLLIISVDNDAYIGSSTISFVIDKASITITANSMTVGKGSAKPALTYTISGLANGEALAAEPTLTCNADMNTVGRYPITINGAEVPVTGNYHAEITYVPGTLTVTVRTSGGNNNGNSSGSENSGDGGQGSSGDNGGGNITLGVPAVSTVADTNPETDTETMKPGAGNTARPGKRTEPESGTVKEERPDAGIPFIKEEVGKIGWNVIREEEEKAEEGSIINVDMNGTTIVPGDIFDSIEGRDITITFDMGNGIIWSVDGKSVTTDNAEDIDLTVRTGGSAVPVEIVNNVTGEHYSIQLSLVHNGEFGFIAVLSINLGKENAGYLASLYYYNEDIGELEFICADEVAQDGTVSIAFTHASDYVIVVDRKVEESDGAAEDAQPEEADENGTAVPVSPKTIQEKRNVIWPIVAGIIAFAGIVFAGVVVWRKKEENKSFKEKDK
ncbi:MAG: leucine-rich repeat protein [Lachnospiraceae bacterium]|nr:leucine-rich repeat protein [Lachnospiraceae bacterium]